MPEPSPHKPLGEPFVELDSVDSTNNYALAQLYAGLASHGAAFFAWEQFAGKGQRGKTWLSEKGNNLILSVVIDPSPLLLPQQFRLSVCLSIGVVEWFAQYAGDATRIKWPNDLYWHDRKAGGMLIESIVGAQSSWKWAVAGIGININQVQFNPSLKNPVSLRQITGRQFEAKQLARELCQSISKLWYELRDDGWPALLNRYNNLLYRRGEKTSFRSGNRKFEAVVTGVDENGRLLLRGELETAHEFGSLEWVL